MFAAGTAGKCKVTVRVPLESVDCGFNSFFTTNVQVRNFTGTPKQVYLVNYISSPFNQPCNGPNPTGYTFPAGDVAMVVGCG